ncbi:hypothetical protein QZJ86_18565 [Methylomonas montana]|uniref:hypothetical protein n=1 Tax=Methylomonas montana TaxID=3058963 RepID=UPI0026594971|nr:hypothetical protein [Methylomonas montana]WKJ89986.1 hypothetical protein QZJ86_18565 [Methylomonas montana]
MTKLAADTVAIHRLTVRAGRGQQTMVDTLRDNLQNADWPHADRDSWVFIRRLQASGSGRQLPQQLCEQTKQYLNQAHNTDEVMRFAGLTELLAALLTDLLRGGAGFYWYWRRWEHWFDLPTPRALYVVMSEHLALLPSISARLAIRGQLPAVWLSLDEADSRQLAVELAGLNGFSLPSARNLTAVLAGEIKSEANQQMLSVNLTTLTTQLYWPSGLLARWRNVLQGLEVSDSRYQLALCLIGQEVAPLLLQQQPAKLLATLSAYFSPPAHAVRTRIDQEPVATKLNALVAPLAASALSKSSPSSSQTAETRPQSGGDQMVPAGALTRDKALGSAKSQYRTEQREESPGQAATALDVSGAKQAMAQDLDPAVQAVAEPAFARFDTMQGGLLYLLNMLNRPEMRSLMVEHAETLPSAWAWLYRLGQELQLREDDALVDFIALQLGLENHLALSQLPALPDREQVLNQARRWYGKTGVWQAGLLALTAQVQYSPSHIDLYAPMTAIRLPVRLAGLDINPGWLPWLGRVVSFHYD